MNTHISYGLIAVCIFLVSCNKFERTEWNGGDHNIIEVTSATEDLSLFNEALNRAAFTESLKSRMPLTIFAPSNEAFNEFLLKQGASSIDDISLDLLVRVLSYHVIDAGILSSGFFNGYVATFCEGPNYQGVSLLMNSTDKILNATAHILETDIMASNGVIHKIDKVLMPPTIIDILRQNGNFKELLKALDKADLDTLFAETGPVTLFAPNDAAFKKYFSQIGVSGISEISKEQLVSLLNHHLAYDNITKEELGTTTIKAYDGLIEVEMGYYPMVNNAANIIGFNLQGYNGIIHVIDQVLIPPGQ